MKPLETRVAPYEVGEKWELHHRGQIVVVEVVEVVPAPTEGEM